MKKWLALSSLSILLLASACSSTVGEDGDTLEGDTASADTTGADTASVDDDAVAADTTAEDVVQKPVYNTLLIIDADKECSGTGPGADLDFVAVYRAGALIGVGKPGTANYAPGTGTGCAANEHNAAGDVQSLCGPFGDLDLKDLTSGYLSLGGGDVEVQLGACKNASTCVGWDATACPDPCDGLGDVVELQDGDEIDVWEIDQKYKTDLNLTCKCDSEAFEAMIRTAPGVDAGSISLKSKDGDEKPLGSATMVVVIP